MKLNNHGWGMRDMIIYSCIMIFLLIFVATSVNSMYKNFEQSTNNSENDQDSQISNDEEVIIYDPDMFDINYEYYYNLEDKVENATLKYMNDNHYDLSGNILNVSLDTLINLGYVEQLYDENGLSVCTGYSNVSTGTNETYSIISRINCGNYVSEGY